MQGPSKGPEDLSRNLAQPFPSPRGPYLRGMWVNRTQGMDAFRTVRDFGPQQGYADSACSTSDAALRPLSIAPWTVAGWTSPHVASPAKNSVSRTGAPQMGGASNAPARG